MRYNHDMYIFLIVHYLTYSPVKTIYTRIEKKSYYVLNLKKKLRCFLYSFPFFLSHQCRSIAGVITADVSGPFEVYGVQIVVTSRGYRSQGPGDQL